MTNQQHQDELAQMQAEIAGLKKNQLKNIAEDSTFQSVLNASPVPQALNDDEQNVIYLNPAFINTFGYDLKDIPTLSEWWPKAYPDPEYRQKVADNWLLHLENSLHENKPFEVLEVKICCKDGSIKTVMAGASPLQGAFNGTHLVTLYDVTETKKVETELGQAVALLENVINSTPDLIAVKNRELKTILCNEAYARAVGKNREEMHGKTDIENGWSPELVEGNPEKGVRGFIHDDNDALSGMDVHNPYDPANVEGETRIFDTHKRPLRNAGDEIIGLLLIARDVTERNKAENRLHESELRFRSIVEGIENIAVQGYDQKRRVIFWNPASTVLYGYTAEEALGKKLEDLIIPDDMREGVIAAVDRWIHNDISIPASEMLLRNKHGQPVPVYSSHTMQRYDDGTAELYCLDVSISELRQTQEELERVNAELDATLRTIPDLLFELDDEGRYINLWVRDEKLLAAEQRDLLGHTVAEKLPQDAANTVMSALHEAAEIGYSHGKIISLSLPAGKFWFELSVAMKPENKGRKHFIVLSRDITERVNTEEQLRRSQKMDALGKLTGGVAHDFNNMLGVILGYGELLQCKINDDSQSSMYVEQIIMAGNRARALTSKLLAFSRKQPAEKKEWNINDILNEDRHMLEKTLTAKVELVLNQGKELYMACIDRNAFSDAILNMCINSMHAMPEGGCITITTENKTVTDDMAQKLAVSSGEYIQISLTDTGTGIAPEIKEKIFEPFFTTKNAKGTGLGLSQVYGFVKQSQGDIQVYSEPGNGTKFIISLPIYKDKESNECCVVDYSEPPQISHNETILIVDDESALRELAGEILLQNNYRVFYAEDANEALKMLAAEKIDLMLTDVIMPGINGYQLADKVAEQYQNIKIIIASGYNDKVSDHENNSNHYQYLDKPYTSSHLLNVIRKLLD